MSWIDTLNAWIAACPADYYRDVTIGRDIAVHDVNTHDSGWNVVLEHAKIGVERDTKNGYMCADVINADLGEAVVQALDAVTKQENGPS